MGPILTDLLATRAATGDVGMHPGQLVAMTILGEHGAEKTIVVKLALNSGDGRGALEEYGKFHI